jgi:hypothetical protein
VPEHAAADPGSDDGAGLEAAVEGVTDSVGASDGATDAEACSLGVEAAGSALVEGCDTELLGLADGAPLGSAVRDGVDGMHAPASSATRNTAIDGEWRIVGSG